jgi:hypothetical protein
MNDSKPKDGLVDNPIKVIKKINGKQGSKLTLASRQMVS